MAMQTDYHVFRLLANRARLDIVRALRTRKRSVTELTEALGLEQSLVSHYLRQLADADLVYSRREGAFRYYSIQSSVVHQLLTAFDAIESAPPLAQYPHRIAIAPVALYTTYGHGSIATAWMSPWVERETGYPPEAFVGDPNFWRSHLHPDDFDRTLVDFAHGAHSGAITSVYRWRCADDSYRWFHDRAVFVSDADGGSGELIGMWERIPRMPARADGTES